MKKKIVFATNNKHKLEEIAQIVGDHFEILSLKDIQCDDEIPETADTFEGNALQKAAYIHEKYGIDCFADDSGLEVEALDNAPGVRSARYSGGGSEQNMDKLLGELKDKSNRRA
ncbi:MAG: non-canonical purine NTP pyrophosphatase, partial [Bacteroidales bacterium]|nr:non-canonical purine NTP pyrophosphatase [Bacteroidales bacterium]